MEKQLERKIRKVYKAKDQNASFARKDQLWLKISGGKSKGVLIFWKVAALFFGLLLLGGAFASVRVINSLKAENQFYENKNLRFEILVDSLINIQPQIITEIKLVEKEKLIYKEIEVINTKKSLAGDNNVALKNENKRLENDVLQLTEMLDLTRDSLILARAEQKNEETFKQEKSEKSVPNFTLKTERTKDQMQPAKTEPSPKMKLQIFKIQDNNIKYDINSTLLRK